jgi:hypothetical protein
MACSASWGWWVANGCVTKESATHVHDYASEKISSTFCLPREQFFITWKHETWHINIIGWFTNRGRTNDNICISSRTLKKQESKETPTIDGKNYLFHLLLSNLLFLKCNFEQPIKFSILSCSYLTWQHPLLRWQTKTWSIIHRFYIRLWAGISAIEWMYV